MGKHAIVHEILLKVTWAYGWTLVVGVCHFCLASGALPLGLLHDFLYPTQTRAIASNTHPPPHPNISSSLDISSEQPRKILKTSPLTHFTAVQQQCIIGAIVVQQRWISNSTWHNSCALATWAQRGAPVIEQLCNSCATEGRSRPWVGAWAGDGGGGAKSLRLQHVSEGALVKCLEHHAG